MHVNKRRLDGSNISMHALLTSKQNRSYCSYGRVLNLKVLQTAAYCVPEINWRRRGSGVAAGGTQAVGGG